MTASRPALPYPRYLVCLLTLIGVLGALCLPAGSALAQSFPSKNIRLVVPLDRKSTRLNSSHT